MEPADNNQQQESHVLIFPFPFQGHINTMLRLAEALSFAGGLRISFLNTEHNHRLLTTHSLRPNIRFLSIPDGLPDDNPRSAHQVMEVLQSLRTNSIDSFRTLLLAGRNLDSDGWPPVTCVIVDGAMPFSMDAANALGVPVNSRFVGEVWKVGLDMKDVCRREMVEKMVRAAMEGEKAEELRQVAAEMAVEIGRSVGEGGESRLDFERLVRDILSLSLCASIDRGPPVK